MKKTPWCGAPGCEMPEQVPSPPLGRTLSTLEWAQERLENSRRIADDRKGQADHAGWLEDVGYWERIVRELRTQATPRSGRSTHTFAELAVSDDAYAEIHQLLLEAGYGHAFIDGAIDMHGIGLVRRT